MILFMFLNRFLETSLFLSSELLIVSIFCENIPLIRSLFSLYFLLLFYGTVHQVTTAQEAFQLVAKGNKVRAVGSTQCNDVSSR